MAFFRNLHSTRILMVVSLKIIMSVLICKFFLETTSAHQGSAPASTGKQLDENVVVGSRIREASLRGSGSTFGWYGNTRTVFMNKVGGVPRWIMLPIGGVAVLLVLICTCYRQAQAVQEDDLESFHAIDDFEGIDGFDDIDIIDIEQRPINVAQRERPLSETRV